MFPGQILDYVVHPKKLCAILAARAPQQRWPAPSTVGDLLRREGLCHPTRCRRRYTASLTQPLAAAHAPNDVWSADFKGWFRTADGTRCDPLTVADACSRFVLCYRIVPPHTQGVRPWFERTFRMYGLPRVLRTDNGAPFATRGPGRASRLAVWWLKLGITLDRVAPGHPEQNGRHERFHLTLQQETVTPPATTARQQQRRFDQMREDFNATRPHEAPGQQPPARRYVASPGPTRRGSRSPGMTPRVRSAACDRPNGKAARCLSERRSAANRWASRKPKAAIGSSASCTWNSAH